MEKQDVIKKMLIKIHEFEIHEEELISMSEEESKVFNAIQDIKKLALSELKRKVEDTLSSYDLPEEKKTEYIRILNIEKNNLLSLT
jgi:hypothetical protein